MKVAEGPEEGLLLESRDTCWVMTMTNVTGALYVFFSIVFYRIITILPLLM